MKITIETCLVCLGECVKSHFMKISCAAVFGGFVATAANAQSLVGSFTVSDGPDWGTNPPTYSCLEACAEVFGGAAGDYSCSTSDSSIDHQAFVDGWGDSQYCSTPVAETFKLNDPYDCGSTGCSYSAYVNDHGACGSSTNYCYAAVAPVPAEPVPVMGGWGIAILSLLTMIGGAFGLSWQRLFRKK